MCILCSLLQTESKKEWVRQIHLLLCSYPLVYVYLMTVSLWGWKRLIIRMSTVWGVLEHSNSSSFGLKNCASWFSPPSQYLPCPTGF